MTREEVKIEGFLVRNEDNTLSFFTIEPERFEDEGCWWVPAGAVITFNIGFRKEFSDIKWEDEPTKVELLLKKI